MPRLDPVATAHRFFEDILTRGELDAADDLLTADCAGHEALVGEVRGASGFKRYTEELRRAFPDLRFTIHEIVAQSETVVTHYTATGTHLGPLPGTGIPPTGKSFSITGFVLGHVDTSNKFRNWFATWDTLGQMQQLGIVPQATLPSSAQTPQPGTQP